MKLGVLRLALSNIWNRKLRSTLTIIGIFIGVATVVALVSLGQGMQIAIKEQFEVLGTDKIFIIPPQGGIPREGDTGVLTQDDVDFVEKIKGVKKVTGFSARTGKLEFDDEIRYYFVIGMPTDDQADLFREGTFVSILKGRDLRTGDNDKVVIGYNQAHRKLMGKNVELRDKILINDKEFKVVGIYDRIGNPQDDSQVYITQEAAEEILDIEEGEVISILAQADEDILMVADRIEKKLGKFRDVEEGKEDFDILTPEQLLETFAQVLDVIQLVLVAIAVISLAVGSVGIMNTMYTSVYERRKEIGVMKAIGAKNKDILTIALFESGILGLLGGGLGTLIGWLASVGVEFALKELFDFTLLQAYFPVSLTIGALLFSFVLGAGSGTLPAYQASRLKPVDTLRT